MNEKKSLDETWPELTQLTDAAAMICVFKIQSKDELTYEIPAKAINELERAIKQFHPKIWEFVEHEREQYLKYVQTKYKTEGDDSDTGKIIGRERKKPILTSLLGILGDKKKIT